ncbi:MAG: DNA translocase FtsK 4TM domain-containing protein [Bacteroidales bacterium]
MAKKSTEPKSESKFKTLLTSEASRLVVGIFLLFTSIFMAFAFLSYLFTGAADQSFIENRSFGDLTIVRSEIQNWTGAVGAYLADMIINQGFGIAVILPLLFFFKLSLHFIGVTRINILHNALWSFCAMIWGSIVGTVLFTPIFPDSFLFYGGAHGLLAYKYLLLFLGMPGTILVVVAVSVLLLVVYDIRFVERIRSLFFLRIKNPFQKSSSLQESTSEPIFSEELDTMVVEQDNLDNLEIISDVKLEETNEGHDLELDIVPEQDVIEEEYAPLIEDEEDLLIPPVASAQKTNKRDKFEEINIEITVPKSEDEDFDVTELGVYDPTLDLSRYKYPSAELLRKYDDNDVSDIQDEQNSNIIRIRETLKQYGIAISDIKATVGPTITLYEIVPAPGVRINKIKNLEDDIALSLAALGIRIIAPIPGKGTVGIEVPNQHPKMVSMQSCIASKKFYESKFELPVALGKTITNDVFMFDLAKMPHLLVAGATGQGKSVGLNAIITSLLYKKHPSQLKFVLVDPKKVEFSIYSMIEKHFLAKLPDVEEPIITDVTKVIQTLNSITVEMDTRYDLLKMAHTRNIKEYNDKFTNRKLNPELGHRYMPYIVVVIDEFGDLIMTAGKEVEHPIARIAQLARAVGIHMILATQRPSTNIITGTIKANFPGRIAFRVASGIDSRTILDATGANQLVGRGDLLFSQGNDLIRVQCAFVDTPEVEDVAHFIGKQQGYSTAFMLPECIGESGENGDIMSVEDRDPLFEDAARFIVASQQGSTSSLQRRMSLGYNRAGRLMDQLESAGIVGPSEGSKPRKVLIMDEFHLEQHLNK